MSLRAGTEALAKAESEQRNIIQLDNIQLNNENKKNKEYMCEICKMSVATVNLDLKAGSHRECRYCWDYN